MDVLREFERHAGVASSELHIRVRVLGSLAVEHPGGVVHIAGVYRRRLLAFLASRAGQAIPVDAIVDALWGDDPPMTAAKTLQSHVARLRASLAAVGTELIETTPAGYRLEGAEVDADLFEQLADRGHRLLSARDVTGALAALESASELWRGEPYADFQDVEFAVHARTRLTALHAVAVEDLAEARLESGAVAAAAADLERLVAADPGREHAWALLMRALYAGGRQQDALVAFQRARRALGESLGLEPGPELRELEQLVLAQDPALAVAQRAVLPAALRGFRDELVGRAVEQAWLAEAWGAARRGSGQLRVLTGPPDSGRTRLVAQLAAVAAGEHAAVMYVRGASDLGEALVGASGAAASACVAVVAERSRRQPVLLVIDDVEWASAATMEILAVLAAEVERYAALLVVVADLDGGGPAAGALRRLDPSGGRTLTLGPLGDSEIVRIADADGVDEPGAQAAIASVAAGLPGVARREAAAWAERAAGDRVQQAARTSAGASAASDEARDSVVDEVARLVRARARRNHLASAAWLGRQPYLGLSAYGPGEADVFVGRERLVAELAARVLDRRLVVVTGASGSGKSSLVRAGLVPLVQSGRLPGGGPWRVTVTTPGADPVGALDAIDELDVPGAQLLVIDQFEEALAAPVGVAAAVVGRLVDIALDPALDARIVLVVRADQYPHLAEINHLSELLEGGLLFVGRPTDDELRRIVTEPAERAGCRVEPEVVEAVLTDVGTADGALPLVSAALAELWDARADDVLTLDAYRAAGGLAAAVERLGERVRVDDESVRRALLLLADVTEDGSWVRRRVARDTVPAELVPALDDLVEARLVVRDGDEYELVHEVVFRAWPRLVCWLEDARADVTVGRELRLAARGWDERGRSDDDLWHGSRVVLAAEWIGRNPDHAVDPIRDFVTASQAVADRQRLELQAQLTRERRASKRLRRSLVAASLLLVVALIAAVGALLARRQAADERDHSRAGELAGLATLAIDEDPERAILLGLAALERSDEPSAETISALHRATQSTHVTSIIRGEFSGEMDQSPDGSMLAVIRADRTGYMLIDAESGSTVADVTTEHAIPYFGLAFDPTGSTLAVTYETTEDGTVPAVELFDVASNRPVGSLSGPPGEYCCSPQYDRAGRWFATLGPTGAEVWDVAAGSHTSFGPAYDAELMSDGTAVVVGDGAILTVFDLATGQQIRQIDTPAGVEYWDFELDSSGKLAALVSTAEFGRRVDVIDMETGAVRGTIGLRDPLFAQFSPDGKTLAVTSADSLIRLYDTDQFVERVRLSGTSGSSMQIFFSPDGTRLSSASPGEIRIWDISPVGPSALGNFAVSGGPLDRLVVAPDEATAYATVYTESGLRTSLHRVDMRTGDDREVLGDSPYYFSTRPLVSPDLSVVATLDDDYVSRLTQLPGGDSTMLAPCESVRAFDPTGRVAAVDTYLLCGERGQEPGNAHRIIDLETGDTLVDLPSEGVAVYAAAFGPAGDDGLPRSAIVEEVPTGTVTLYDLTTGGAVATYTPDLWVQSLAMSPDGARAALLTESGRLIVLDLARLADGDDETDPELFEIAAHAAGSKAVAFSASGLIATGSSLDGIRVWSPDGELLANVPTNQMDPPTFAFAPGSDTLYYEDANGVVRRFEIDVDALAQLARSIVTRDFTQEECERYFPGEACPTFETS